MSYRAGGMAPHRLTENIPEYLRPHIVQQNAALYTPIDHASWRFILKISQAFFATHAHQKYLDGLRETGISTERIPLIEEMDACLRKFNWRAVAVSGFIPPGAFMEFLSLGVLPIACDMRKLEHIAYTPAPDIVHEAAGHAPIIADPEYADYLRHYGEISRKAIMSKQDLDVYNAVRCLSDIKEDPASTREQIEEAQKNLDQAVAAVDHVSEATQLARMGWWTIEYGLVGEIQDPKIYGAGLLSSVGESYHCFSPAIRKIPFSIDCVNMSYDITQPQPQLYVAKSFSVLIDGLKELESTMAFRRGGEYGLSVAKKAGTLTTAMLDSGLQISGVLANFKTDRSGKAIYLKHQGPTQLSFADQQLPGQGASYHREGYGCPVGKLKNSAKSPADLADSELTSGRLEFDSGVVVSGHVKETLRKNGKLLIVAWEGCTVSLGSEILFRPEWGTFDMGCGVEIGSVYNGPADSKQYFAEAGGYDQPAGKPKTNLTDGNRELNQIYAEVRKVRENGNFGPKTLALLQEVHSDLENAHRDDWLLRWELLELVKRHDLKVPWEKTVRERLSEISRLSPAKAEMINRGLALL